MLQIDHLTLVHRRDLRVLAEDFSFVLNDGDKAAVIGEEGNGKSTLLKWIFDPALVEPYCQAGGVRSGQTGSMGYLSQDLTEAEKAGGICEYCAAAPDFYELTPRELGDIARRLQFQIGRAHV